MTGLGEADVDAHGVVNDGGGGSPHAFLEDVREDVVTKVREWIDRHCEATKHVRRAGPGPISSYGWKHVAENGIDEYVANGEFIAAAIRAGYRAVQCDPRSPNAYFNMRLRRGAKTYSRRTGL